QALIDTKEWLDCQDSNQGRQTGGQPVEVQSSRRGSWCKPSRGWVKCNYDASHYEGVTPSGLGWIIRDSHGTCLECGMGKFQGRLTVEEAECTAFIWAIQATWALGYRHVEFEGDNASIVKLINEKGTNLRLQHYLNEIWQWRSKFTSMKVTFRHREKNGCAD
ncbi:Ribonuclease H domain, partial [Arabidopsis suecica]